MKEYPILFSAPMVNALLTGRKSVTRRMSRQWLKVKAGDRLWVRETLEVVSNWGSVAYAADPPDKFIYWPDTMPRDERAEALVDRYGDDWNSNDAKKIPSIFMPRWASRILLECDEDARLVRLQDITEDEAKAEGAPLYVMGHGPVSDFEISCDPGYLMYGRYKTGFQDLWGSLHTKPGERWEDNPEIVRVGPFRRIA